MMIEIRPFKAEDVTYLNRQTGPNFEGSNYIQKEHYFAAEKLPHSYTILIKGRIVACCGVIEYWKDRGEAWSIIDRYSKAEFVLLFRTVKKLLEDAPIRRIEATINKNFPAGHRWIKLLGFELEAETLKSYGLTGDDYSLYAKVKHG
jgi:hypothetical protein